MLRITLMVLRCLFHLPFRFYQICKLCDIEKYDAATRYAYLHKLVKTINRRGRIVIDCHGLENLPKESGYIMFPNHQGLFDSLAFLETHERPFVPVTKKEVKDVILLKQVFWLLQSEVIDREDIRQSMQVIVNMTRRVKNGENFLIFAEGTRSRKGNTLLEFKGGSFKSAMNAKCPIVPVALIDSFVPFDRKSLRKVTVQLHYLKPLYYEDYKDMKSTEIAELVSSRIQETINQFRSDSLQEV